MRILLSILLIFILLFSLILGVDESAMKLHDEALDRSMIAFGLAKGLNAIISLIQGTELSFAPVGIGLNFSVGEVLDPFNDMVERFSWIMLASSVSLGIQKILLVLSSKLFLQIALSFSIAISLFLIWKKKAENFTYITLSFRVLALLLILRFAAIIFVYSSDAFYNSVLNNEFESSSAVLEKTKERLEEIQSKNREVLESKKESAWYNLDISSKYQQIKENLNISAQLERLQQSIEDASKNIINLITIFVVQNMIMPLLFLWFFIFCLKWTFRVKIDDYKMALILK